MNSTATLFDADAAAYTGTVEVLGVIFRAEDDGYAVLEVQDAESGEGFALVGPVAHLGPGDRAEVSGEWQTHSRYGRQLRARGALPLDPADREGQVAYLTSLRHIGPARAERLVDEHGEGVLGRSPPTRRRVFASLRGVSADQAAAAAESWHASRAVRDLHVQLAPHGLAHLAAPIHARFGDRAMAILHEDPYRLTEVAGVGFARADKIALAADVPPESSRRAQAAAAYALSEAEQQGNSYLPLAELTDAHGRAARTRPRPRGAREARRAARRRGPRLPRADPRQRGGGARTLRGACRRACRTSTTTRREHPPATSRHGTSPTSSGRRCAAPSPRGSRCSPAAPASARPSARGRSSPRPRRPRCGRPLRPDRPRRPPARGGDRARGNDDPPAAGVDAGREPAFNPGHPLPADLVIVDESSMLNLRLAEVLLGGLAESTHIVFVGDADQLPPIGAGKPFEDLIDSGSGAGGPAAPRSSARRRAR